jgi:hypothetical protein
MQAAQGTQVGVMKRTAILAVMVILAGCACVRGDPLMYFEDGNKLYRECSSRMGAVDYDSCLAYVQGVADAMEVSRFTNAQGPCVPKHVQLGQVVDVTRAFLRKHPESRHKPAAALAIAAIYDAFCPDQTAASPARAFEAIEPPTVTRVPTKK